MTGRTPEGLPSEELNRLYGLWSDGGAGILLSGNIQVIKITLKGLAT